jgi:hypothetical protein
MKKFLVFLFVFFPVIMFAQQNNQVDSNDISISVNTNIVDFNANLNLKFEGIKNGIDSLKNSIPDSTKQQIVQEYNDLKEDVKETGKRCWDSFLNGYNKQQSQETNVNTEK